MALQEPMDTSYLNRERINIDQYVELLRNTLLSKYGNRRKSVVRPGDSTVVPYYLFKASPETLPYGCGYYDLPESKEDPFNNLLPRVKAGFPPRYFGLMLPGIQILTRVSDFTSGAPQTATRWLEDPESMQWSAWEPWWVKNAVLYTSLVKLEKLFALFC